MMSIDCWKWPGLVACCALAGCGAGDSSRRAAAHGTVTVDGRAIDNGAVQFVPTGGTTGPVTGAIIEGGQYWASRATGPVVGMNRVQITGSRKTGKRIRTHTGEMIDEYAPIVPERYGATSTQVVQVKPGDNVFDFELTSK